MGSRRQLACSLRRKPQPPHYAVLVRGLLVYLIESSASRSTIRYQVSSAYGAASLPLLLRLIRLLLVLLRLLLVLLHHLLVRLLRLLMFLPLLLLLPLRLPQQLL